MEQGLQVAHGRGNDSDVSRHISRGIVEHRLIELDYYKENEDEFFQRRVEPYALVNGREGWYVASFDPAREDMRHSAWIASGALRSPTSALSHA